MTNKVGQAMQMAEETKVFAGSKDLDVMYKLRLFTFLTFVKYLFTDVKFLDCRKVPFAMEFLSWSGVRLCR